MAQAAVVVLDADNHDGLLGLFTNKEVATHSIRYSYQKIDATFYWDGKTTYMVAFAKDGKHVEHKFTIREQIVHDGVEHL